MAVVLQFRVDCSCTEPGEAVYVVGSAPELGAWNIERALPCLTNVQSFPLWASADVAVAPGTLQFKCVVAKPNWEGPKWEGGDNKEVEIPSDASQKIIICCQYGKAGAALDISDLSDAAAATTDAAPKLTQVELPLETSIAAAQASEEAMENGEAMTSLKTVTEAEAAPEVNQLAKIAKGVEPLIETVNNPMDRMSSRFLVTHTDGSLNLDMTRTPSLMLIDPSAFNEEAERHEKELIELERERLNKAQRRMASGTLLQGLQSITDFAEPSDVCMLQGFNWESHKSGKGDWYSIVASKIDMLSDLGITDIWLPPCSASVAPQGYLPSQMFNLDASAYGNKESLKNLISKMHDSNIRAVADIVINHRCGDKQDAEGRWNVFTTAGMESRKSFAGVMDWQGWAVTLGDMYSDGTGQNAPGTYDGKFDAAPDIDHANEKVQESIKIWMRWLRLEVGFDAWRFDFVKGYGAQYVSIYCKKTEPAWAVGELWLDMVYDGSGLAYNQDKHRQDTINWINATDKTSTAFDFTTKGILQEAVRKTEYWRLKDSSGKPPGLLGWMPTHAVTFLDNHDTGSTQGHWPFPSDKVMIGYAYILTHPGIPCIFWDHIIDWGDAVREDIKKIVRCRRESGIPVDAKVNIQCAENDIYLAEIGEPPALRVALGPRHHGDADSAYWNLGAAGNGWSVWVSKTAKPRGGA